MDHYELDDLLYRLVLDPNTNTVGRRVVIPDGGLRAFHFNGRRYRLTPRKTLLLLHHDSESIGGHPSIQDTLAKISDIFWWPTMEYDVKASVKKAVDKYKEAVYEITGKEPMIWRADTPFLHEETKCSPIAQTLQTGTIC